MNLNNYPQWFVDSFLDFYELLNKKKELLTMSRSAVIEIKEDKKEISSGCLLTRDFSKLIVIGKKVVKKQEPQIFKYIYHLNEQEKENLSKGR